jgi:hypothetical protein
MTRQTLTHTAQQNEKKKHIRIINHHCNLNANMVIITVVRLFVIVIIRPIRRFKREILTL